MTSLNKETGPVGVLTRRAVRLGVGLARHRLLFPALYVRQRTLCSPSAALEALGFDRTRIAQLEHEYAVVQEELFPAMLRRAREVGALEMVAKLEHPELAAHDSKKLAYLGVRLVRPRIAVETGTFSGGLSTFILRALADNGAGRLISFDLPAYRPIKDAIDYPLPVGQQPGWIIPDDLRSRLELVLGDTRRTLAPSLAKVDSIDVFVHDSLHTFQHMLFEYRQAWRRLSRGGLLISDDVFHTPAFWLLTQAHRLPFLHIGNMGIVRKPAA